MAPRRAASIDRQVENTEDRQGNVPPPPNGDAAFRALEGSKKFSGTTDPFSAEGWIRSLEVHFRYLNMGDANRVRCAMYMLKDDAFLWWEGAEHGIDLATLTWVRFKEIFYEKYFTPEVRGRLKREFMSLSKGDTIVAEFVRKFDRSCHFVPLISRDDEEKLRHFMDDLRPTIRRDMKMMRPADYEATTTCAFQAEQALKGIDDKMKRKRQQHQQSSQPNKKSFMGPPRAQGQQKPQVQVKKPRQPKPLQFGAPKPVERPLCKECNRLHFGKCMWETYRCFICKEEGHKAGDCSKKKEPTMGRAYVMHAEKEPDTTLITCNLVI
ncbi:uncharacterized protein [Primulina huaijiensis]|uniref:uncharacterized protein n=1 Tax=Primulina huaijiensis TaxID=1492673 RepID=UPI003CC767CA